MCNLSNKDWTLCKITIVALILLWRHTFYDANGSQRFSYGGKLLRAVSTHSHGWEQSKLESTQIQRIIIEEHLQKIKHRAVMMYSRRDKVKSSVQQDKSREMKRSKSHLWQLPGDALCNRHTSFYKVAAEEWRFIAMMSKTEETCCDLVEFENKDMAKRKLNPEEETTGPGRGGSHEAEGEGSSDGNKAA